MYFYSKKGMNEQFPPFSVTGLSRSEYIFNRWKLIKELKYHPDPKVKKEYNNMVQEIIDDVEKKI